MVSGRRAATHVGVGEVKGQVRNVDRGAILEDKRHDAQSSAGKWNMPEVYTANIIFDAIIIRVIIFDVITRQL